MYRQLEESSGNLLGYRFAGRMTKEEMERYDAEIEHAIDRWGKVRLLILMEETPHFELGALWEDFEFAIEHVNEIERMALVGDKLWEKGYAKISDLILPADVEYFTTSQLTEAWQWLRQK